MGGTIEMTQKSRSAGPTDRKEQEQELFKYEGSFQFTEKSLSLIESQIRHPIDKQHCANTEFAWEMLACPSIASVSLCAECQSPRIQ
jgi:hypothetical protein